jgi:hypothetical protein
MWNEDSCRLRADLRSFPIHAAITRHVIVPGGGLPPDGLRWIACKPGFFLPVRVLSRLFRHLFLEGLAALYEAGRLMPACGELCRPARHPQ